LQQALGQWQETEGILNLDEVARRSSLLHGHVNILSHYDFTPLESIAVGQLRSLRTLPN
jgi:hypothetical protein